MGQTVPPHPGRSSNPRMGARVASEVVLLALVLASVLATLALIVEVYRRQAIHPTIEPLAEVEPVPSAIPMVPEEPEREPEGIAAPKPVVVPPPEPPEPREDPTKPILEDLNAQRTALERQIAEATETANALESEQAALEQKIEQYREHESQWHRHIQMLDLKAEQLAAEVQFVAMERDILARQRDKAEQDRAEAAERPGWAILPYKGPNGTWRRPIPIECTNGTASLPPGGPTFSLVELTTLRGSSSPFVSAVIRLFGAVEVEGSPDGERVAPYILFLVRPDGIRPFYEAKSRLEPLGIEFGYELVGQDWEIEFPEIDDPTIWGELQRPLEPVGAPTELRRSGSIGERQNGRSAPNSGSGSGALSSTRGGRPGERRDGTGRSAEVSRRLDDRFEGNRMFDGIRDPGVGLESGSGRQPSALGGAGGTGSARGGLEPGRGTLGFPNVPQRSLPGGPRPEESDGFGASPIDSRRERDEPRASTPSHWQALNQALEGSNPPQTGSGLSEFLEPESMVGASASEPGQYVSAPERSRSDGAGEGLGRSAMGEDRAESGSNTSASGTGEEGNGPGSPGVLPLRLVIACGPKGVVVHPGGYRLTTATLEKEPSRFVDLLEAVVENRRQAESSQVVLPNARFIIEPGGAKTYQLAHRQFLVADLNWPVKFQVSEHGTFSVFGPERW